MLGQSDLALEKHSLNGIDWPLVHPIQLVRERGQQNTDRDEEGPNSLAVYRDSVTESLVLKDKCSCNFWVLYEIPELRTEL